MDKSNAIRLLGGTPAEAARAIGISTGAIAQWPDVLPSRLSDRVVAAIARKLLPPDVIGAATADAPKRIVNRRRRNPRDEQAEA